jgi:hypothetical protein
LIEQEAKQKELKDKQRGLQENEEQIKRQIQVWKDLQVMTTCLPHMLSISSPSHSHLTDLFHAAVLCVQTITGPRNMMRQYLFDVKRKCLEKQMNERLIARKGNQKQDHLVL